MKTWGICYYTVNEDGTAITLHGAALSSIYNEETGNTWVNIDAQVQMNGNTLCGTGIGVEVRGSIYDYHFPASDQPDERNILPVQSLWIDPHMSCYVENAQHPYGDELDTRITDVQILGQYTWNEAGEESETDERIAELTGNSEEGWELRGDKLGFVKLKLTYDSLKEGEGSLTLGENPEEEFRVNVFGEVYHLNFDYPDAVDCMLTGSTIEVRSNLWVEYVEGENGAWNYRSKELSDYRLVMESGYNTDLLENVEIDTDSEDRPLVRITSKEEGGSDRIYLAAYLPDENGAYTVDTIGACLNINVGEDYWYLTESGKSPASIAQSNKQWVGTCLYQEWYKPLLISCEAAARL